MSTSPVSDEQGIQAAFRSAIHEHWKLFLIEGIVLTLLGFGFMLLRHVRMDMNVPMLVLGTVVLMPGLGFILSAGVTWVLAGRLGLMPDASDATKRPHSSLRVDPRDGP